MVWFSFSLLNKAKEAGSQNCFAWDWMSLYWTEQQNTALRPSVPSQIFWPVGEGWETQAPFTDAPDWKWTQNIQPTTPPSYTTIVPAYNNPESPHAAKQLCQQRTVLCSTSPATILHMCCGLSATRNPGASATAPAALQHVVLRRLSPASPQHPPSTFCVLLPWDSAEGRPSATVSMPDPMYHRPPAVLDVDREQLLYISRLSSMSQYFLQTCLQPLKAEQTEQSRQRVTKTVKAIFN